MQTLFKNINGLFIVVFCFFQRLQFRNYAEIYWLFLARTATGEIIIDWSVKALMYLRAIWYSLFSFFWTLFFMMKLIHKIYLLSKYILPWSYSTNVLESLSQTPSLTFRLVKSLSVCVCVIILFAVWYQWKVEHSSNFFYKLMPLSHIIQIPQILDNVIPIIIIVETFDDANIVPINTYEQSIWLDEK